MAEEQNKTVGQVINEQSFSVQAEKLAIALDSLDLPKPIADSLVETPQLTTSPITATVNSLKEAQKLVPKGSISELTKKDSSILPPSPLKVIVGTEKDDFLIGTFSNDLILGFGGKDVMIGLPGNDIIRGGTGNDMLYGGPDFIPGFRFPSFGGNDYLSGDEGKDILIGGKGNDVLNGGPGYDTADYSYLGQAITLERAGGVNKGRAGNDRISDIERIVGAKGKANAIDGSTGTSGKTSFDADLSANRLIVKGIPGLGDVKFKVENFVDVIGTSNKDNLTGNNSNNKLTGGEDDDKLSGLGGHDTLAGVDPSSKRPGFEELDTLSGGGGKDTLVLGDRSNPYYVGGGGFWGLNDFALIKDFQTRQDKIQLKKGENYVFGKNIIAIGKGFNSLQLESLDKIAEGISNSKDFDASSLSLGSISQLSKADPAIPLDDSLTSSQLIPIENLDIIGIVRNGFNQKSDLVFV